MTARILTQPAPCPKPSSENFSHNFQCVLASRPMKSYPFFLSFTPPIIPSSHLAASSSRLFSPLSSHLSFFASPLLLILLIYLVVNIIVPLSMLLPNMARCSLCIPSFLTKLVGTTLYRANFFDYGSEYLRSPGTSTCENKKTMLVKKPMFTQVEIVY